ncbi:histidinol-phosphatase [Vagococcus entomophilus]|uniref:Histidinol-phosphatase n=1 Tax=Vagococcus entomophilus TaxID=1160095 RepID=A0A430AFW4_9ENTE|nr:histidinol-phosphatase [Vagococcus entomophilus]
MGVQIILLRKRDGHTHTEYCPHGTVDDVELLIQKAISLGFQEYSITEHAPLPKSIYSEGAGPAEIFTTGGMAFNDVDHYLNKMARLKQKYKSDLCLHIGFEVDYFDTHLDWTKDFLNEYGPKTDDGILSVHFLPGIDGLRGIDFSAEDYSEGIVRYYQSFQKAQEAYYDMVLRSLEADLGPFKPTRLGHISLCQKFQDFFQEESSFSPTSQKIIEEILLKVAEKQYSLDLNTAGLYKEFCNDIYPPAELVKKARSLNIPLVYGSDSHDLADIGRGYTKIEQWI